MIVKSSLRMFLAAATLTGLASFASGARAEDILDKNPSALSDNVAPAAHPAKTPTEVDLPSAPSKATDQAYTAHAVKPEVVKQSHLQQTHAKQTHSKARSVKTAHAHSKHVKGKKVAAAKHSKKMKKGKKNAAAKHHGKKKKAAAH